jgi:aldose 1-epimerase
MYLVKRWFRSLFQGVWLRKLMRSGMVTGLILAAMVVGLGIAYREHMQGNFHKLKVQIGNERQEAPVPLPGGQEAIVLTRTPLPGGGAPEFLSVTMLPGRGMNVLQIMAYLPDKGEVELMASPKVEEAAWAMTGRDADANGGASLAMGGAFEAPWAGRIWGVPLQGRVSTVWRGHQLSLPASGSGATASVALDGLMLARAADSAGTTATPDGGQAEAVFQTGDFGAHWPSKTEVTVTALLNSRSLDLTVVAHNVGDVAEPVGIGWHPRFAVRGERGQLRLRIPGQMRAQVRDPQSGLPTGLLLPVAGTAYDFTARGGAKLGTMALDDSFVQLHQEMLDNGPVAELSDPANNYGLRLTAMSSAIKAIRVVAPAGADYVSIEPQFNYDDPLGREWGNGDTGMVVLQPGESTQWKVRIELFGLSGSVSPQ